MRKETREIWVVEIAFAGTREHPEGWHATTARSYHSKWHAQRGQKSWRDDGFPTRVRAYVRADPE